MLGVKTYPQDYIDASRARVAAQVASFRALAEPAHDAGLISPLAGFSHEFFNNMVIVLDATFVHRLRGVEGKDGNPLNEVRMLANSLTAGGGLLTADKTIRYDQGKAVLGLPLGQPFRLSEDQFVELADAFYAELERKFT
jgi:hypothetical protein